MQNITQTVRFPVSSVISSKLPDNIQELLLSVRQEKRSIDSLPGGEQNPKSLSAYKALKDELDDLAGPKLLKEIKAFGANSLADDVDVNMQIGTVLFDICTRMMPEPQAPLAKLIWRKKCMELAEVFGADEFVIPESAVAQIRMALTDETAWKTLSLTVWVDLPLKDGETEAKRHYFTISSQGAVYFSKVLGMAAESVYPEDLKDAK